MNPLSAFGWLAVAAMLLGYALERRSFWFTLGCAVSCALGFVEAVGALVAARRWWQGRRA